MPAGKFKDQCLKVLDRVAEEKTPVTITKRGRPVATLVPYSPTRKNRQAWLEASCGSAAIRTARANLGMPIFLDTHSWVWWVTEDRRLSRRASGAIQEASHGDGVSLSMISIWEVAKKVEKKQLVLDRPLREWMDQALSVSGLRLVELTPAILVESCDLPQPFHGDPADQMIVASVRHHRARLVTKDRNLRRYQHLQTIW